MTDQPRQQRQLDREMVGRFAKPIVDRQIRFSQHSPHADHGRLEQASRNADMAALVQRDRLGAGYAVEQLCERAPKLKRNRGGRAFEVKAERIRWTPGWHPGSSARTWNRIAPIRPR